MDEQTKTEAVAEPKPTEDNGGGDQPKPLDKVEQAKHYSEKLEEQEKRLDQKIAQLIELKTDKILGGGSEAGSADTKKEIMTPKDYANSIMGGKIPPKNNDSK